MSRKVQNQQKISSNVGFKHTNDFSNDEKKDTIDQNTINVVGPKVLNKKYNTMAHIICHLVILILFFFLGYQKFIKSKKHFQTSLILV